MNKVCVFSVLATNHSLMKNDVFSVEDESDMILTGYLAFLDPPKPSAAPAIKALAEYGVTTKILTGDNDKVTQAVSEKLV